MKLVKRYKYGRNTLIHTYINIFVVLFKRSNTTEKIIFLSGKHYLTFGNMSQLRLKSIVS